MTPSAARLQAALHSRSSSYWSRLRALPALVATTCCFALFGCEQGEGRLWGSNLTVEHCDGLGQPGSWQDFDLTLRFMAFELELDVLTLRFAPVFHESHRTDQFGITISDVSRYAPADRTEPFTTPVETDSDIRAGLVLFARCPRFADTLSVTNGTVTFDRFLLYAGGRISGTMAFDVLNKRTGEIVGTDFGAEFDFDVNQGTPYSPFSEGKPPILQVD